MEIGSVAVTPDVLVDVALEPLLRYMTVRADDPVLHDGPEALDRVLVNVSDDVLARRVVDLPMVEHLVLHCPLGREGVRVHDRTLCDDLTGASDKLRGRHVENRVRDHASTALNDAGHRLLLVSRSTTATAVRRVHRCGVVVRNRPMALATDVGLVNLSGAVQDRVAIGHQLIANPSEHAPRGLVGHAQLALKLLGREASVLTS